MNKKVVIAAPVHNRRELTLQCLKSLSRIDRKGLDIHIVIVDDGSTDGTSEAIKKYYPEVEIVKGDGNLWYTAGTNLAIETAMKHNPDYILAINDDSVYDEKFLCKMVECAEKHPRSVVGALLLLWDMPHKVFQVSPKWNFFEGGWKHWTRQTIWTVPQKPWEVEMIVGNCVLYPAQVVKEVGLMDAKKFQQFGDAEYTIRMRKNGWRLLIEPRARVFCQPNDLPVKVLSLPLKDKVKMLFTNRKTGHNLINRFYFYLGSAPSKVEGFAAYWMFFTIWFWKKLTGKKVGEEREENLAKVYANFVVKD